MGMITLEKIYMDVCCLNRPLDDQSQTRIHIESEAVLRVLRICQSGDWELVGSEAVDLEIKKTPDESRKRIVSFLASLAVSKQKINNDVIEQAKKIEQDGLKAFDALHLACAEEASADVLLTTDDKFLNLSEKCDNLINTEVCNPVNWLMEVLTDAEDG